MRIGPGAVVAAAFVGPGVTTCALAGTRFGYTLLWALTLAALGAIVLQEMSARFAVMSGLPLGEAIRRRVGRSAGRVPRFVATLLIVAAIGVGNAAYQAGNVLGASFGLRALFGSDVRIWVGVVALVASALLWAGSYRVLERVLVALLGVMAVVFVATAVAVARDPLRVLSGAVTPVLPDGAAPTVLALVGVLILPFNLFLHASAVRERWQGRRRLADARTDLVAAIALGGIVAMAIVVTAAAVQGGGTVADLVARLESLVGAWARIFFAAGLVAAGLAAAVTAPLAAAYALAGALGWVGDLRSPLLRGAWVAVMSVGAGFALAGAEPSAAVVLARLANGVLLPVLALFLLVVVNDRRLLKTAANGWLANVLGGAAVLLAVAVGTRAVIAAFHQQ